MKSRTFFYNEKIILICLIGVLLTANIQAQESIEIPDLSKVTDVTIWHKHNRSIKYDNAVHLDAMPGDGLLQLNDFLFENGRIELEIRGEDNPGRSFVGFAFHIQNDSTFDAIYFRPFNFRNSERKNHSVQYISHPTFTWSRLREESPDTYENEIRPVPDPDNWFKATIIIDYPEVKVYVNDSQEASLSIEQLSEFEKGGLGFWVGHNSKGSFRNLKIKLN
jgi:hypothetical protein